MSNKSSDKKQTKLRGERWQTKKFIRPEYVPEMRNIIRDHTRLSPTERKVGLTLCDLWEEKCDRQVHPGFDAIAERCDLHRNWISRCLAKLKHFGLIHTNTPRWDKLLGGRLGATEINMNVKLVTNVLRAKGVFSSRTSAKFSKKNKSLGKLVHSVSANSVQGEVNKTGLESKVSAHNDGVHCASFRKDEVASALRSATAAKAASSLAPRDKERKASAGISEANAMEEGLGAEFDCPDGNWKAKWFPAKTERPFTIPMLFELGTRVGWDDSIGCPGIGTVLGFGTHTLTASYLLVQWDDEDSPGWISYEDVRPEPPADNVSADTPFIASPVIAPATQEPVPGPMPVRGASVAYSGGERVRNIGLGAGTVRGMAGNLVTVDFDNGVTKNVPAAFLELISA